MQVYSYPLQKRHKSSTFQSNRYSFWIVSIFKHMREVSELIVSKMELNAKCFTTQSFALVYTGHFDKAMNLWNSSMEWMKNLSGETKYGVLVSNFLFQYLMGDFPSISDVSKLRTASPNGKFPALDLFVGIALVMNSKSKEDQMMGLAMYEKELRIFSERMQLVELISILSSSTHLPYIKSFRCSSSTFTSSWRNRKRT